MDHSPIRQTFELGKFVGTAGKSIINLVKLGSLVAKYRKMWKIQSCEVCEFCILLYYARKNLTTFTKCGDCLIYLYTIVQSKRIDQLQCIIITIIVKQNILENHFYLSCKECFSYILKKRIR